MEDDKETIWHLHKDGEQMTSLACCCNGEELGFRRHSENIFVEPGHWLIILVDANGQAAFLAFLVNNGGHCTFRSIVSSCHALCSVLVRLSVLLPIATHTSEEMMDGWFVVFIGLWGNLVPEGFTKTCLQHQRRLTDVLKLGIHGDLGDRQCSGGALCSQARPPWKQLLSVGEMLFDALT